MPLYFDNILTIVVLVDLGAYVIAIAQDELDTLKQKALNNTFKIDDPPKFEIQVANGQLVKALATVLYKFDIGDNIFAENFVTMKKLKGPIIGLQIMRNNSEIIDTTHVLAHFAHMTKQLKTTSEMSAKPQAVPTDDALTIQSQLSLTILQIGLPQVL